MKIYYSPIYKGTVFSGLDHDNACKMDTMTVDDHGLLGYLQMVMGIHHDEVVESKRMVFYYEALGKWLKANEDNELAVMFENAGLEIAKICLGWRDELVLAGWTRNMEGCSDRLKTLAGAEQEFYAIAYPEQMLEIERLLAAESRQLFADVEVVVPCSVSLLRPIVSKIIGHMKRCGAKVSMMAAANQAEGDLATINKALCSGSKERIRLKNDGSIKIYEFDNEYAEDEYFTMKSEEESADVWIKPDSKALDNMLKRDGKATTGSTMTDVSPQVVQLFMLGVKLFKSPADIHTVLEWLSTPLHPLKRELRIRLADKIVETGGYDNKECRKIIEDYIEEEAEKNEDVKLFLPFIYLERIDRNPVVSFTLLVFMDTLRLWAIKRSRMMAENGGNSNWVSQLHSLIEIIESYAILLSDHALDNPPYDTLESWAMSINASQTYEQYPSVAGCQMTIDDSGKMAAVAKNAVWMDVEGVNAPATSLQFLLPSERKYLEGNITFWDAEKENALRSATMLMPLRMTEERLVITYCKNRHGEPTQAHELIVRLRSIIENWDEIVTKPDLDDEKWVEAERTHNEIGTGMTSVEFKNKDLVTMPEVFSPTSIDTLIQYPFDYLMDKVLHIRSTGPSQLPDIKTTKGNVAHATIAALFFPKGQTETPAIIRRRCKDKFDEILNEVEYAHGGILLLTENKIEERLFREDLRRCVKILLEIIIDNRLTVTGCEVSMEQFIGLTGNSRSGDEKDIRGFIDMTLVDKTGTPVVFDFKWTSSKDYHEKLLKKNVSIQLEIYKQMLSMSTGKQVERVAYFVMPRGLLLSTQDFNGYNCIKVEPENDDVLMQRIKNSVRYRIEQLKGGVVEIGDGRDLSLIGYENDVEDKKLIHLNAYKDGIHDINRFSNYNLFKGL